MIFKPEFQTKNGMSVVFKRKNIKKWTSHVLCALGKWGREPKKRAEWDSGHRADAQEKSQKSPWKGGPENRHQAWPKESTPKEIVY